MKTARRLIVSLFISIFAIQIQSISGVAVSQELELDQVQRTGVFGTFIHYFVGMQLGELSLAVISV